MTYLFKVSFFSLMLSIIALGAESQVFSPMYDKDTYQIPSDSGSLLGERIDIDSGSLSFYTVDVSIPGNSDLPVQFGRRLSDRYSFRNGAMGNWRFDVPQIIGVGFRGTCSDPWKFSTRLYFREPEHEDGSSPGPVRTYDVKSSAVSLLDTNRSADPYYLIGSTVSLPHQNSQEYVVNPLPSNPFPSNAKFVSRNGWVLRCVNDNYTIATSPEGTKYHFNVDAKKYAHHIMPTDSTDTYAVYASRVEDVHGNWVRYEYATTSSPDSPVRLTRIHSNDGREITVNYNAQNMVSAVNANGRTWQYSYTNSTHIPGTWGQHTALTRVTLPDGTYWDIGRAATLASQNMWEDCRFLEDFVIKHPNGLVGTFKFKHITNGIVRAKRPTNRFGLRPSRFFVNECGDAVFDEEGPDLPDPRVELSVGVIEKTLSGPAIPNYTWTYEYEEDFGNFVNEGPVLAEEKKRTITDPNGARTVSYVNRRRNSVYQGRVAREERYNAASTSPVRVTEYEYTKGEIFGVTPGWFQATSQASRPTYIDLTKVTVTQGSDTYTSENSYETNMGSANFSFGKPISVKEFSSTTPLQRITDTSYVHYKTPWILNLPSTIVRNGKEFERHTFNTNTGKVLTTKNFGVTTDTYTYNADGTVASHKDGLNRTTSFGNYKRGLWQSATQADGTIVSQSVDDNGWITSVTDGRANTTSYTYNTVGWLTNINRPGTWAGTTISYASLGAGVVQTSTRGNSQVIVSYDALRRPYLTDERDLTGHFTPIYKKTSYDGLGRPTFTSFPSASSNPTAGTNTSYDALGRVTQNTETVSPFATTSTAYLTGNRVRVTDPSGAQLMTTYRAFGAPATDEAMQVVDATGTTTTMTRDIYGNITSLNQSSGLNGYSVNVNRQFWYDDRLRLCRHRAPEFGDELFAYNNADEMTMASRGEAAGSGCATPTSTIRTNFFYDSMGRQTGIDYRPGNHDIIKTYDANGNLLTVNRGGINWTYRYNELDLMDRESLQIDGRFYLIDHNYNPTGHLTSRRNADGSTVHMSPDGFGRPRELRNGSTSYVSNIAYHPNGAVATANYGNGRSYTQTLTPRLQPFDIRVQGAGGTLVNLQHNYDARSKVTAITDYVTPTNSRSFTYDPRGRLLTASGSWGTGSFLYDGLDNIRQKRLGSRYVDIAYNGTTNLVSSATDTAVGGARTYTHDPRGNVTNTGPVQLTYDQANQPTSMTVSGSTSTYTYDGNFKRVKSVQDGKTTYWVYSALTGTPLYQDEVTDNIQTSYMAAGGAQVRLKSGVAEYTHLDHQGSPIAASGAGGTALWTERYTPFGEKLSDPSANRNDVGYTGHVQDDASGLTYMQARYYDPVIGRFLSTDPIGYQDQLNLYAYVHNDPMNMTDPTGEQAMGEAFEYMPYCQNGCESLSDFNQATNAQLAQHPTNLGAGLGMGAALAVPDPSDLAIAASVAGAAKSSTVVKVTAVVTEKAVDAVEQGTRFFRGKLRAQVLDDHRLPDGSLECKYCTKPLTEAPGQPNSVTVDHVIPYAKGGKTVRENGVPACPPCNSSKGSKDLGTEWDPKDRLARQRAGAEPEE